MQEGRQPRRGSRRGRHRNQAETSDLLTTGAVYGFLSWILGFILTYIFYTGDSDLQERIEGDSDFTFEAVGMVFNNAHFSNIEITGEGGEISISGTANLIRDSEYDLSGEVRGETMQETVQFSPASPSNPEILYHLIPIFALVIGGYLAVRSLQAGSVQEAAIRGASVTAAYLPLSVLGMLLFTESETESGIDLTLQPELLTTVFLMGLIWPLAVGALGGVVRFQTNDT
jgi:hypothetical protein